jgi:hypothetical protein
MIVTGALIWAVPGVQILSSGAFATAGSGQPGPSDPGQPATGGSGTSPVAVLGETFGQDPGGTQVLATHDAQTLPETGPGLPIEGAVEAAAGMIATGALLTYLARRAPQATDVDDV